MAAKLTLFAYVQGADLEDVVAAIEPQLDALVEGRKWISKDVWVVNQREPGPEWDLGLNLALTAARSRPPNWIEDAIAIATSFASLHQKTKRTFVIGVHDSKTSSTRDLFVVDSESPDLDQLRAALARSKQRFTTYLRW